MSFGKIKTVNLKTIEANIHITITYSNLFITISQTHPSNKIIFSKHLGNLQIKNTRKKLSTSLASLSQSAVHFLKERQIKILNVVLKGHRKWKQRLVLNHLKKKGFIISDLSIKPFLLFNGCRKKKKQYK